MLIDPQLATGHGLASLALLLIAALVIDAALGGLGQAHDRGFGPRAWIGVAITRLARAWNQPSWSRAARRRWGAVAAVLVVALAAGLGQGIDWAIRTYPYTGQILALVVMVLVFDQRAAFDRARAFLRALSGGDTSPARHAGQAIDRRPASGDVYAVTRVAVETMGRALTRGVAGPSFWFLVFGLAGALGYLAIVELDRRLGEPSGATQDFGAFAARLDDVATFIPARLAGLLVMLAAVVVPTAAIGGAARDVGRAAQRGASVNLRWVLGPVAGALGLALGGPYRRPDGDYVNAPWIGSGRAKATGRDIRRALVLLAVAALLHLAAVVGLFAGLAAS